MFYRQIDDHLALRLFSPLDAEEVFEIIERDRTRLAEYLGWVDAVPTLEDQRRSLETLSKLDLDNQLSCFITLDDKIIGAIGMPIINRPARWAEIGYWIDSQHEGKGYVAAAVREMERLCFESLGMQRVQITADADNQRSRAVPERLGYTLEGVLRQHMVSGGGRIADRAVYALLKSEWEARAA